MKSENLVVRSAHNKRTLFYSVWTSRERCGMCYVAKRATQFAATQML